ncbi:hypothetical protein J2861_004251 [Agrobacterium tumefaciens]|nr:hypothetical protein [Agrobacterium tumefaciens]
MTNFFDFAISRLPAVVADGRGPAPCEIEAMLQKEPSRPRCGFYRVALSPSTKARPR